MKISKKQEMNIRKEFRELKNYQRVKRKKDKVFIYSKCRNLLKFCRCRWDCSWKDVLDEAESNTVNSLIKDFRNGY